MAILRFLILTFFVLYFSSNCICSYIGCLGGIKPNSFPKLPPKVICKIVLPHKLRYLENMLNSEVVAKAAKIRQRMEANPSIQDNEKGWPMLLAQYQADDKSSKNNIQSFGTYENMYNRRLPNF